MKLKNKLFLILLTIVSCLIPTVNAKTNAPSNFTINKQDLEWLYGTKYISSKSQIKTLYKVTTDGKIVYCIEPLKSITETKEVYTLSGEISNLVAGVIANGYPKNSITGDAKTDYFITNLAIWYALDPEDYNLNKFDFKAGTYYGEESRVAKEITKLIEKAKSYKPETSSLKINNTNTTLSLSTDGKYYISNTIKVSATNISGNYKVSLTNAPKGTIITNTNGKEQTSFAKAEGFIVKVPVSNLKGTEASFTVNVSATGSVDKVYKYVPANNSHQSLATIYQDEIELNDKITLNLKRTTKVSISKLDIANDEEVKGAHLVVKDSKGNIVEEWVSDGKVHVIENLPLGTYTLTETIAPVGYVLSKETVEFTLTEDKIETSAVMYNSKEIITKVSISKQDITTGEELEGAHLVIKDSKGNVIDEWVSEKTPHIITGVLKKGETYTLTETIAPVGYVLSEETIEFTVDENGEATVVVMYNAPSEVIKEVPKTSSFKTLGYSFAGILIISLGLMIIYRKTKENE